MEEMSSEQLLALIDNIKTPLHAEEPSSLPQGAQWKDCLKVCHRRRALRSLLRSFVRESATFELSP